MDGDDLLTFKEFEPVGSTGRGGSAQININSPKRTNQFGEDHLQDLINDMSASAQVMGQGDRQNQPQQGNNFPEDESDKAKVHSFFSIEYYQQFFNVDTNIVVDRILSSMVPRRAPPSYLKQHIGTNPDLYGPVWIVITLIFSIAISGNVADYLQRASTEYHWKYNFHLVSIAATTIVMYVCFVPLGLWAAFKWFVRPADPDIETENPYTPSLLTLICIYGYSLVIYIPVSILWVIQISFLQWILVLTATFLSGSVLVLVLSPALRVSRGSLLFAISIVGAHFLLATGFMLYFFHVPGITVVSHEDVQLPAAVVNKTN